MDINSIISSLYVINKEAKKFRDLNYAAPKNILYDLKEKVMVKLIEENILTYKGYHTFQCEKVKYDLSIEYYGIDFDYYVYEDFGFHKKRTKEKFKSDFLGFINNKISSEKIYIDLTLMDAIIVLNKYLKSKTTLSDIIFSTNDYSFIDRKNIKRNTLKLFDFLLKSYCLVNVFFDCCAIEIDYDLDYLSKQLNLTKQTIKNNFKKLLDLNLIEYDFINDKYYIVNCDVNF